MYDLPLIWEGCGSLKARAPLTHNLAARWVRNAAKGFSFPHTYVTMFSGPALESTFLAAGVLQLPSRSREPNALASIIHWIGFEANSLVLSSNVVVGSTCSIYIILLFQRP